MFKTVRHYIGKKKRDAWYEEKNRFDNLLLYFKYIALQYKDRVDLADTYLDFDYEGDHTTKLNGLRELNNKLNAAVASNMSTMNPFAAKDMYNHFDGMPGFLAPNGAIKFGAA